MTQAHSIPNPSQSHQILSHLKSGKPLTAMDALSLFGCNRLAARVHDLKMQGHPICKTMKGLRNRYGTKIAVAEYSLIAQKGGVL